MTDLATAALMVWLQTCSLQYGVEPEFSYAVMRVESGNKYNEIRIGPMGKSGRFVGPMGINKIFASKYDIYDPYENIRVGVKALRGKDKRSVLKNYNRSFTESYYRAVMSIYRKEKREGKWQTASSR